MAEIEIPRSRDIPKFNNRQVFPDTNQAIGKSKLEELVDRMKRSGDCPALIVLIIYVKAMDHVSVKILLITQETDKLSSVMSDLLSLSTSLSKIQNQLGPKKEVTEEDWNKFDGKHLTEIQKSYNNLVKDCKKLKEASITQPDFKPIVTAVEGVIDDFDTKIGDEKFSEDIIKWDGKTSFQGDKRGTLQGDVVWLAKQFYQKNHDTDDKGVVDYLSMWVQGINAAQQLGQTMSQQKVVDLQAQMQFISSFNSSGQQTVQASKEEASVMVHNQAGR